MLKRINKLFNENYSHCKKTLKELSKDNDGNVVTDRIDYAYDFDTIASNEFKSCDALVINNDNLTFIEFKNQPVNKANKNQKDAFKCDLKLKALESLIAISSILKQKNVINNFCEFCNVNTRLIVIYSSAKSEFNRKNRSRMNYNTDIRFLNRYKGKVYNDILIIPNTEFLSQHIDTC